MSLPSPRKLPSYTRRSLRDHLSAAINDLVAKFLYYDRKESESLPLNAIKNAVAAGAVAPEEIVELFASELRAGLGLETAAADHVSIVRGLRLMQRHLDEGGHEWSGADMTSVAAARAWLAKQGTP